MQSTKINKSGLLSVFSQLLCGVMATAAALWAQVDPPQSPEDFTRVEVVTGINLPMAFKEGPDNMLYIISQTGEIHRVDPLSGVKKQLINLDVFYMNESGGLGIAPHPAFAENGWIFVFYTPLLEQARVSRFTVENDSILAGTESVLMEFTVGLGGHMAGKMLFDQDTLLYIATGANDGPKNDVNGWQTSANTLDFRGKILRIKPTADGSYTVPQGNLFAEGTENTFPEIYTMGHRNPFGMGMDASTGILYVGEVGGAREELNRIPEAGNYGYPQGEGNESGGAMSNTHESNTGITELPDALPSWLSYNHGGNPTPDFDLNPSKGSACLVGGPVYRSGPYAGMAGSLPEIYEGNVFFFDCYEGQFYSVNQDSEGTIDSVAEAFQGLDWAEGTAACCAGDSITGNGGVYTDMQITESGHVFVLEYWDGKISRVDYTPGGEMIPLASLDRGVKPRVRVTREGRIILNPASIKSGIGIDVYNGRGGLLNRFQDIDWTDGRIKLSLPGLYLFKVYFGGKIYWNKVVYTP